MLDADCQDQQQDLYILFSLLAANVHSFGKNNGQFMEWAI